MVRCTETCSTGDKHWSAAFDCNTSFVFITTHHTGMIQNKVLLETLCLKEIKKELPAFYATRMFIIATCTTARHLFLS